MAYTATTSSSTTTIVVETTTTFSSTTVQETTTLWEPTTTSTIPTTTSTTTVVQTTAPATTTTTSLPVPTATTTTTEAPVFTTTTQPDTLSYIPNTKGFRMNSTIAKALDLGQRLVSLFIASALPIITGGAILGVDVIKSAGVAGLTALFGVVQKLAAASVDGELTSEEISAAFGTSKKKTGK